MFAEDKKTMIVSIITPTYNCENSIDSTLSSVAKQSSDRIEHIIVDNMSSDNTLGIVNKYHNKYDLKVHSEPDNGIADAFNKGIGHARGDWLYFLGAGDTIIDEFVIENMIKILQSKKENDLLVWGNVISVSSTGTEIQLAGNKPKHYLKRYNCYHHQSVFHRSLLFSKYGKFNEGFRICMDYDLMLRIYESILPINYVNIDIAKFMEDGVSSENYLTTLKEFREAQIKNKVRPKYLPFIFYIYSSLKYFVRIGLRQLQFSQNIY